MTHHRSHAPAIVAKPTTLLLAAVTALSLLACAGPQGRKIESSEYGALTEGKTTRAEVVRDFGEPEQSIFMGSEEMLTYNFVQGDSRQNIPLVGALLMQATGAKSETQNCVFGFDAKGILLRKQCGGGTRQGPGMLTGVLPK